MLRGRRGGWSTRAKLASVWLALLLVALPACTVEESPEISSVEPNRGYPRQLLAVRGDTLQASVVWDVGLSTETEIFRGLFSTNYFQIPAGATPGTHPIALRNSEGTGPSVNVDVLAGSGDFPAPRVEDVGVFGSTGTTTLDLILTLAAANMDTTATITVDGSAPAATVPWGALPIDYQLDHVPASFNYPVYHYEQQLLIVENVAIGSTLAFVVTNSDGQTGTFTYELPADVANLDGDGDGLLDTWETSGYTAPSGAQIDLGALGTNVWRKDILIETDWVSVATPNNTIWATIEGVFDDAPVLNPDGSSGINAIIDRGQGAPLDEGGETLAAHTTMDFGPSSAAGYTDFYTYKANNFDSDRLELFHYGVFGRAMPGGFSGRGEIWGNDFQVTFVTSWRWGLDVAEVGTFVHELGHNLALRHGGIDDGSVDANELFKPNMASTMNYRYQFPGVSDDCDYTPEGGHTYSQGWFRRVTESNVNESAGICDNNAFDMSGDGSISTGSMDTNTDGDMTDTHNDYDQWGNLELNFRAPGSRWDSD